MTGEFPPGSTTCVFHCGQANASGSIAKDVHVWGEMLLSKCSHRSFPSMEVLRTVIVGELDWEWRAIVASSHCSNMPTSPVFPLVPFKVTRTVAERSLVSAG